mmetsp:Transcript_32996/g.58053  ORF Transcript_32996/g.58053 Transcript_32996/m.58053 type:complete len:560 (-) Transcript_32996:1497-3176(-)
MRRSEDNLEDGSSYSSSTIELYCEKCRSSAFIRQCPTCQGHFCVEDRDTHGCYAIAQRKAPRSLTENSLNRKSSHGSSLAQSSFHDSEFDRASSRSGISTVLTSVAASSYRSDEGSFVSRNEVYCEACKRVARANCKFCGFGFCQEHIWLHQDDPLSRCNPVIHSEKVSLVSTSSSVSHSQPYSHHMPADIRRSERLQRSLTEPPSRIEGEFQHILNEADKISELKSKCRQHIQSTCEYLTSRLEYAARDADRKFQEMFDKAIQDLSYKVGQPDDIYEYFTLLSNQQVAMKATSIEKLVKEACHIELRELNEPGVAFTRLPKTSTFQFNFVNPKLSFLRDFELKKPTLAMSSTQLYIIGGKTSERVSRGIYSLDIDSIRDARMEHICDLRDAKSYFAAVCKNNQLFVIGGNTAKGDTKFVEIVIDNKLYYHYGQLVASRRNCLACVWHGNIFVIGGADYIEYSQDDGLTFTRGGSITVRELHFLLPTSFGGSSSIIYNSGREFHEISGDCQHPVFKPLFKCKSPPKKCQPYMYGDNLYWYIKEEGRVKLRKHQITNLSY